MRNKTIQLNIDIINGFILYFKNRSKKIQEKIKNILKYNINER